MADDLCWSHDQGPCGHLAHSRELSGEEGGRNALQLGRIGGETLAALVGMGAGVCIMVELRRSEEQPHMEGG